MIKEKRHIKYILMIITISILLFELTTFSQSRALAVDDENKVFLYYRQFVPLKGINVSKMDKKHFLIQFEYYLSKEEKELLERKGIKLLGYIPHKAWFVSLSGITPRQAVNLPNVNFIGDILPEDKIQPDIQTGNVPWAIDKKGNVYIHVQFHADISLDEGRKLVQKYGGKTYSEVNSINTLSISLPNRETIFRFAEEDAVQWIEYIYPPPTRDLDSSTTRININNVQAAPYNLNGSGIKILVHDDPVNTSHPDLSGRVTNADGGLYRNHSVAVAGIIAGDGSVDSTYKGIAPKASIITYNLSSADTTVNDLSNIESKYSSAIATYGVTIASNSWKDGDDCASVGNYTLKSRLYDNLSIGGAGKPIIIVFSAGNRRDLTSCGTNPGEWANYKNIPSPKAAKNMIVVGAINSDDDSMTKFSAWGPVMDGRIKPDVVAPGCEGSTKTAGGSSDPSESIWTTWTNGSYYGGCGTSYSAPHVAGVSALMLQQYSITYGDMNVLPSTIKAILIHTAVDLNNTGPDYSTGYGRIDAKAAVDQIISERFLESNITGINEVHKYNISLSGSESSLKVTLVWDDWPAEPNTPASKIENNLQLKLVSPNGTTHYPWLLDYDNPGAPARKGMDNKNNVEQVYVDSISATSSGIWIIEVYAGNPFLSDIQNYSLISSVDLSTRPSTPTSLLCDGGSCNNSFYNNIDIQCLGSIDNESDTITYFVDAYYSNSVNFSLNHFSNNLEEEDLVFNLTRNFTRYIDIPKDANITSATINLIGYIDLLSEQTIDADDEYSCVGTFNSSYPCTNAIDENSNTYGMDKNNDGQEVVIYENFTKPSNKGGAAYYFRSSPGACSNAYKVYFYNDSSSSWQLLIDKSGYCQLAWKNSVVNNYGFGDYTNLQFKTVLKVDGTPCSYEGECDNPNEARDYEGQVTWYNFTTPTNPYLEVGAQDGDYEWNYSGEFNTTTETTSDFSSQINAYLSNCTPINGNCTVPLLFHSDKAGRLQYSVINITYKKEHNWMNIGNHIEYSNINWNITVPPMTEQGGIGLRCSAVDLGGSNNYSEYYYFPYNLTITSSPPPDQNKFYIQNSSGSNVAYFGDLGNIVLKGSCSNQTTCAPQADSFIFKDSSNNVVAYINSTGDICIETGDCSDNSPSCNPSNDAFIVQDSNSNNVSYIDLTNGDLCLTGNLTENGNP